MTWEALDRVDRGPSYFAAVSKPFLFFINFFVIIGHLDFSFQYKLTAIFVLFKVILYLLGVRLQIEPVVISM